MENLNLRAMEDSVLLGSVGPVYTFVEGLDQVHAGIGIRLTGPRSAYEMYYDAAERLVFQGLLKREFNGDPVFYYRFTERGKIAHWAMREAVAIRERVL